MNYVSFFLALALTAPLVTQADWEQTYLAPSTVAAMRPHAQGFYDDTVDKTFLVHGDSNLDAWVTAYDHAAEDWIPSVRVAGNFHDDNYHNYPVITRDAQGYIHVFIGRGNLTHTRSLQPRDLQSGWTDEVILKNSNGKAINSSYPLPVLAENGDLYLFFRTAAHGGNPIHFIKTIDNGATWTDQRHVIEHDPRRADQSSNLYLMGIEHVPAGNGRPERILLCWINAGPGADGKGGYNSARKDVFFAFFNLSDELLYAADGTALGDVIRDDEAEAHCKVDDFDLYQSTSPSPGAPLAQNLGFPPGPTTNDLQTLLFLTFSSHPADTDILFDSIFVDAAAENLTGPLNTGGTTVVF